MDTLEQAIENKIKSQWNTESVSNVVIDVEFGNVTATIDGTTFCDCGWIEDYSLSNELYNIYAERHNDFVRSNAK